MCGPEAVPHHIILSGWYSEARGAAHPALQHSLCPGGVTGCVPSAVPLHAGLVQEARVQGLCVEAD
ncbi:hypothetical protein E2C01_083052 [Portunus trituberculatus]|uniref:Uncharacterized protein n=1 Tax=Portunus trituberculatus TaxID=210409 RepID=A0A5B7J5D9_PORTR|nr:hypothetical protein [Portunus trituberculatus]